LSNTILSDLNNIFETTNLTHVKTNFLEMFNYLENDKGRPWDLEDIESDLRERRLLSEFEWDEIRLTFEFLRNKIFSK
jgi:hypothetical protein